MSLFCDFFPFLGHIYPYTYRGASRISNRLLNPNRSLDRYSDARYEKNTSNFMPMFPFVFSNVSTRLDTCLIPALVVICLCHITGFKISIIHFLDERAEQQRLFLSLAICVILGVVGLSIRGEMLRYFRYSAQHLAFCPFIKHEKEMLQNEFCNISKTRINVKNSNYFTITFCPLMT